MRARFHFHKGPEIEITRRKKKSILRQVLADKKHLEKLLPEDRNATLGPENRRLRREIEAAAGLLSASWQGLEKLRHENRGLEAPYTPGFRTLEPEVKILLRRARTILTLSHVH